MGDDELYRVVLNGAGTRTGTVASSPRSRAAALAGEQIAAATFAADIAAGDMRVELVAEAEYQRRQQRQDGGTDHE